MAASSTGRSNIKRLYLSLHSPACIYSTQISEQTSFTSTRNIKWMDFIIGMKCVYCAVRDEFLYVIRANLGVLRNYLPPSPLPRQCERIIDGHVSLHGCRDSSVGIVTELRAARSGDRIPVVTRFSARIQTGTGAYPTSCTMVTGSFLGGKEAGVWCWSPTPIYVPR